MNTKETRILIGSVTIATALAIALSIPGLLAGLIAGGLYLCFTSV